MPTCPMCSRNVYSSSICLENALDQVEEYKNTLTRVENRGVINFVMGIVMGLAIGGVVLFWTMRDRAKVSPGPVPQVASPSR